MVMNYLRYSFAATLSALILCSFSGCGGIYEKRSAQITEVEKPTPPAAGFVKTKEDAEFNKSFQMYATDSTAQAADKDEKKPQDPGQPKHQPAPNADWDKKIIKTAVLNIEIPEYKAYNDFVHTSAKQFGGYIAQEEQNESEYKIENIITIKVPVDQFDNALKTLSPEKGTLIAKKVTSEDVTGEVVDTKSRLEAKRQARLRYLDLLKQAKNMEEVLQVQQEIDGIQAEMEAAAGRVNYLSHASAYSTINLTFFQVLNPQAQHNDEPGYGTKILTALKDGLKWVGDLFVLLLTLWPLWAAGMAAWWVFRKWRAGRPKTQPPPVAAIVKGNPQS